MADGVTLTAGADATPTAGTVIATDDAGASGHVQLFKLAIATDGSATLIPADANGLSVQGAVAHDAVDAGSPVKVGGYAKSTAPTAVADADRVNAWFTQNGALMVAASYTGDAGSDGRNVSSLPLRSADGTTTATPLAVGGYAFNGTTWDRLRSVNTGQLVVTYKSSGGTEPLVATGGGDGISAANSGLGVLGFNLLFNGSTWDRLRGDTTGGQWIQGAVAHDGVDSGNPLKIGGRASSTTPTSVADGDRANIWVSQAGALEIAGVQATGADGLGANTTVAIGHTNGSAGPMQAALIGYNGTTWDRLRSVNTGQLVVTPKDAAGAVVFSASAALGDNMANPTLGGIGAYLLGWDSANSQWIRPRHDANGADALSDVRTPIIAMRSYNGTGVDRVRNNTGATLVASGARSSAPTITEQTNYNARGVMLILNVTSNPGGGETLSLKIQAKDDQISSSYIDVADAGVVITAANGTKGLLLYPGTIAADMVAGMTGKSGAVPRTWRAVVTHSGGGSWTYSLTAHYIL